MKTTYFALAVLSCAVVVGSARGQSLKHPVSVQPASLNYDNYYYYDDEEESPSDTAPATDVEPEPEISGATAGLGCNSCCDRISSCSSSCDGCGVCDDCCGCECNCFLWGDGVPFTLFANDNCLGLNVGLWTQVGYFTEGTNGFGTLLQNNYPNNVQLQQQWAYMERKADGACGLDWGFRADIAYGTDGPDTQAFGGRPNDWDNDWDHGFAYGWAIPQLYAELAMCDLTVKLGKFWTVLGYEVVDAPGNFFYSHSFSYYREPFTHTGAIAEYEMADCITLVGGWGLGFDTGFSSNGGNVFLGGLNVQLTDNTTFSYMSAMGDVGYDDTVGSDTNGYAHTCLLTYNLGERWKFVLQSNLIDNDQFLGSTSNIFSLNKYILYKLNDCVGLGGRFEYFKDPFYGQGASAEVGSYTVGMNWRPHANVVFRPEMRWDNYHPANVFGLRDSGVFGIDCVLTY